MLWAPMIKSDQWSQFTSPLFEAFYLQCGTSEQISPHLVPRSDLLPLILCSSLSPGRPALFITVWSELLVFNTQIQPERNLFSNFTDFFFLSFFFFIFVSRITFHQLSYPKIWLLENDNIIIKFTCRQPLSAHVCLDLNKGTGKAASFQRFSTV